MRVAVYLMLIIAISGARLPAVYAADKPLTAINDQFRQFYAHDRDLIRAADSPVIVATQGKLIFFYKGQAPRA